MSILPTLPRLSVLLLLACVTCATAEGRMPGARASSHARCEFPKAAWNEEVLQARDAAMRECKENQVRLSNDHSAAPVTEAQERFHTLLERHQALLRNARAPAP